MPVSWKREDVGYAAATAAAVAFLAYLVFGNFGLVPSPLAPAGAGDEVLVATQAVDLLQEAAPDEAPVVAPPAAPSAPPTTRVPVAPPAAATDAVSPNVAFTTPSGTSLAVTEPAVVEGVADDDGSGIQKVTVTFTPGSGSPQTVAAKLTCSPGRSSCGWTAKVPGLIGGYTAVATATDRDGNSGESDPIDVTVVNVGGAVDELTDTLTPGSSSSDSDGELGEAVGDSVDGLGEAIGGLLGIP